MDRVHAQPKLLPGQDLLTVDGLGTDLRPFKRLSVDEVLGLDRVRALHQQSKRSRQSVGSPPVLIDCIPVVLVADTSRRQDQRQQQQRGDQARTPG